MRKLHDKYITIEDLKKEAPRGGGLADESVEIAKHWLQNEEKKPLDSKFSLFELIDRYEFSGDDWWLRIDWLIDGFPDCIERIELERLPNAEIYTDDLKVGDVVEILQTDLRASPLDHEPYYTQLKNKVGKVVQILTAKCKPQDKIFLKRNILEQIRKFWATHAVIDFGKLLPEEHCLMLLPSSFPFLLKTDRYSAKIGIPYCNQKYKFKLLILGDNLKGNSK